MRELFEKNKILLGIIVTAFIIGGFIYFSSPNEQIKELRIQVASLQEQIKELSERIKGEVIEDKCFARQIDPTGPTKLATVTYIFDGDTIEVDGKERVRYLGINTPESGRPYFSEATELNKKLVNKKEVLLEFDVQTKDQYGRTLAYVWIGDTMVNLELICRGYANIYTSPPNLKYADLFLEAEREAREARRGLWARSKDFQGIIKIVNINADAPGNDNENKNGEWVEIKNQSQNSVNIKGWTLEDEANHIYTFPDFSLAPGKSVFIYSGCGIDTQEKLYWQCPEGRYAIWNNSGDTAFLRDASGNLVDSYKY